MKKLFILCTLVLCLFMGSVNVFADGTSYDDNSTKITVTFKRGTTSYTVNEKNVTAEASVLVLGKTFVPVNVITDALNATLTVDLKAKTAVINYNGVEIKLTDKKKEAVIAGKTVKLDDAPYIKNSSFMASISFLADTLGADVSNVNGQVTFIKEIANPNSIKDFSTLIKKTTKNKIGDSYYNWSMLLPDDLKLDYRNFIGTQNEFAAQDDSYYISVYISDSDEGTTLDDLVGDLLEDIEYYTLVDYGIKNENGVAFVEFVYKDDYYTYQDRVYLSGNKKYEILLSLETEDSYLDDKYQNIMNSFQYKFNKDGSTEELSDVSAEGYRKYQDTRLKWSIDLLPDWKEDKDEDIQNVVDFYGRNEETLSIKVYSLDQGETLDSITKEFIKEGSENYNPTLYSVTKQESIVIDGVKCNKVYYTLKLPKDTIYGCDLFVIDKDYKYILGCKVSEKEYKDSTQKNLLDGMINSFRFKELDKKSIGKLLDPGKVVIASKMRKISTDLYSMEIPTSLDEGMDTDTYKSYSSDSLNITVSIQENTSLSDYIKDIDDSVKKDTSNTIKIESKTSVNEKGTPCYKYILSYEQYNSMDYRLVMYVMQKGNKIILVNFAVDNMYLGTKNSKIIDDVWKSFTLK